MRALFMFLSGFSHISPSIPLAWALRSAGHEVLYTGTGERTRVVAESGLSMADTAPESDVEAVLVNRPGTQHRTPGETQEESDRIAHLSGMFDPAKIIDARDAARIAETFAGFAALTLDGDLEIARRWRPDVIIHEPSHIGAPLVATRLGIPRVQLEIHLQGVDRFFHPQFTRWLAAHHGVPAVEPPAVALGMAPPSVVPPEPTARPMRYLPHNGGGILPDWVTRPAGRPRVCLTLGTVVPGVEGVGHLKRVVHEAARSGAEIVLAVGDSDLSALGDLPANVRPTGWIPLHELLPTCAAVVHHGGDGTTFTALARGVPQLIVPHGNEQLLNTKAVAGRGVGIGVELDAFTTGHLSALLDDAAYRAAAEEVRTEIEAMPAPADTVPSLVRLLS
ncbi:nucleotide disphospho-sugar-binding domain-containing protein [Streptomyces lydicus]|uniref:nucleotide disphospho-sugar-binding domain-containing protein n=1 Tax=Streptomyces lydicus TaxID=47763 RepID=UPI0036F18D35